jgi:putative transposase
VREYTAVKQATRVATPPSNVVFKELEAMAKGHIQDWLQQLLEAEVTDFLGRVKSERKGPVDGSPGYRNGFGKPRRLATSFGTMSVQRPRVRDTEDPFESKLLPLFVRRTHELGAMLPELYLHGLARGDFELALRGLLGDGAPLSESSIDRLKAGWVGEFAAWCRRDLSKLEIVYVWADGIYVKAGFEKDKACLLVLIGATRTGEKVLLALVSGHRESEDGWAEVLRDLKARGLNEPKLLCADGHLGIWSAVGKVWPTCAEQRCWNHKIRNVADKLPQREQAEALKQLKAMPCAKTKAEATRLRDQFVSQFQRAHPKATKCLLEDWERLVTFYAFPAEHWKHLRTTNVVESPFATVRLRTDAAKRFKKVENATALMWKVLCVAEKNFRKLNGAEHLRDVLAGRTYVDGVIVPLKSAAEIKLAA